MKKILFITFLLLLVVSIQEPSFASYTEEDITLNKMYDIYGSSSDSSNEGKSITPYSITEPNATMYSVNYSYYYDDRNGGGYLRIAVGFRQDNGSVYYKWPDNYFINLSSRKPQSLSNATKVFGINNQFVDFYGKWFNLDSDTYIKFHSVKIRRYYVDNISLNLNEHGHVEITITQNKPNTALEYVIYNANTGNIVATVDNQNKSSFQVSDTNPAIGVANRYKVLCRFKGNSGGQAAYSSYIYIPVDIKVYDAVRDDNGTALSEAREAANNTFYNNKSSGYWSYQGYSKANSANTNAANAANLAKEARDKANTASSNTSYNNKTSGYWSYYGYSKANSANTNTSYIRNTQLPKVENEINNIKSGINDLSTQVTNIENNMADDSTPPVIIAIKGKNSATCTTGSTFNVEIQAIDSSSDNIDFRVKADTGGWSSWKSVNSYATATSISGNRAHTISVEAKDISGNVSTGTMTMFKL